MIDPKELRIGNLVQFDEDSSAFSVSEINATGIEVYNQYEETWIELDQFSPIPITPEWLERLGFELIKPCGDEGFIKWKHKDGVYLLWIEGKFWHDHWSTGIWITSVHQLQNLYFALTGTELKIKQP